MTEYVGDRDIAPAMTATTGSVIPDGQSWLVVVGADGQPTDVISPSGAVADDVLVTDAAVPLGVALGSAAFRQLNPSTAVVVTSGVEVVGVWFGDDLMAAALRGGTRDGGEALPGDVQLPGRIRKKNISRRCRHLQHARSCATILIVPEKPDRMPPCPAQPGIAAHTFEW